MKYRIFGLIIMFLLTISLNAQMNLDPSHKVYDDIYTWENKGYINNLPPFKPYPLPVLETILNRVIENGSISEKKITQEYLGELENRAGLYLSESFSKTDDDYGSISAMMLKGSGKLSKYLSVGVFGGAYATLDEEFNPNPAFTNSLLDYNTDVSNLGPFELLSSFNSVAAFGTDRLWAQAALGRSSFGPFNDENVFFSPEAPQTGYFVANWYITDNLLFTKKLHQLVATDLMADDQYPDKYLSSHGLQYQAFSWLNIGIYEAVLYGGRFDLLYLLPLTQLMYSQGVNAFRDNNLIGVTGEIELPQNINIKGNWFVDDFDFNNTMKLNFDAKYKFGFELRTNWAPELPILREVEVGYSMLTPHMYTHEPDGERDYKDTLDYDYTERLDGNVNYYNYTSKGVSLGSQMNPNSDKIRFTSKFRLPFNIDATIFANLIRTANSNDSIKDEMYGYKIVKLDNGDYFTDLNENGQRDEYWVYIDGEGDTHYYNEATVGDAPVDQDKMDKGMEPIFNGDGSVNDHGVIIIDRFDKSQNHWYYLWNDSLPFLSQDSLFQVFQTGITLSRMWKFDFMDLNAKAKYTYQNYDGESDHFINAGVELFF